MKGVIQFSLYKFGIFVINRVPLKTAYGMAEFLAELHFKLSARDRNAVIRNLRQITGRRDDLSREARQVFANFARYLVDFFLMSRMVDIHFVRDRVKVVGGENLIEALSWRKGVVILTGHIGNWEMGAAVLDKLGHPVTAVALPHKHNLVNRLFNGQREAHGVRVVPANTAVRRCVEALRKGGIVAVLGDRDFGTFGEPLDFLDRKTLIPKGAAFFACRTGAPIVPAFLTPDGNGNYLMEIRNPILPPGEDDAAQVQLMRTYLPVIEAQIRKDPTQWLMFREYGIEFENLYPHPRP